MMNTRCKLIAGSVLCCLMLISCNVETMSPYARNQKLWSIKKSEITRNTGDGLLYHYLHSKDTQIRVRAILALGRIGNPEAIPYLLELLNSENNVVVRHAIFALGLIGDRSAEDNLIQLLDREPDIAIEAIHSLGMLKSEKAIPKFYELMTKSDPSTIEAIAYALVLINQKNSAPELRKYAAMRSDEARSAILYALYKLEDMESFDIFLSAMNSRYVWTRFYGAKGLSIIKRKEALPLLYEKMHDPEWVVVLASMEALGNVKETDITIFESMLETKNYQLRFKIAEMLAQFNSPTSTKYLKKLLNDDSAMVRGAALNSLARINQTEALHFAKKKIDHKSWVLRAEIAKALSNITTHESYSLLKRLLNDRDMRVKEASLESIGNFMTSEAKSIFSSCIDDNDLAIRAICAENLAKYKDASFYDKFVNALKKSIKDGDLEGQSSILKAMVDLDAERTKALLEESLGSPDLSIRILSASLLKEHYNIDENKKVYENNSAEMLKNIEFYNRNASRSPLIYFETTKGNFVMRLNGDDAPLHTANMISLARDGFYNGLIFHRVVPGFVVQGGDPRGDGWGTGHINLPDEINQNTYNRGSVGMPLAGKDTGGCQFFITLTPQPRLNYKYTLFGEVQEGMSVIDSIEIGDSILKTIVIE